MGAPNIYSTGGKASLRSDLEELIIYAKEIGMVSALLTNGRRPKNKNLDQAMVEAGNDHFQTTLESNDPKV